MRWLSNTYDPKMPDARLEIMSEARPGQTAQGAWLEYKTWLSGKVIGEPQATESHTVDQLKAAHLVGVYAVDTATKGRGIP